MIILEVGGAGRRACMSKELLQLDGAKIKVFQ